MMTVTKAIVATARKVNLKAMMGKEEGIIEKESSKPFPHCQSWNMSATAIVRCPRCFWNDNNFICPICGYDIPVDKEHIKEAFARSRDHDLREYIPVPYDNLFQCILNSRHAVKVIFRPRPHVCGYFRVRNFFVPDTKIYPSTRSVFNRIRPSTRILWYPDSL